MQFIDKIRSVLSRLNMFIIQVCKALSLAILTALVAVVITGVFFRYVLNSSLSWSEDVSKILLLWLIFLASPIALRLGELITIDFLTEKLPSRLKHFVLAFSTLLVIAFCVVMVWQGELFALNGWKQVHVTVGFSMFWVFVAIPLGSFFMLLVAIEILLEQIENLIDPELSFESPALADLRADLHGYGDAE